MLATLVKAKFVPIAFVFLLISLSGKSQEAFNLDLSSDSVAYFLQDKLTERDTSSTSDFIITWDQLAQDHQQKIINDIEVLGSRGFSFAPLVPNYIKMINLGVQKEGLDNKKLTALFNMNQKVIQQNTEAEINTYLINLITFFDKRALHTERAHSWLVFNDVYTFEHKQAFISEITPDEEVEDTWEEDYEEEVNWEEEEVNWEEEEIDWEESEEDLWEEEEETWEDWDTAWEDEEVSNSAEDEQMLSAMGAFTTVPEITGPSIVFEVLDLNLVTPYDSVVIKKTTGALDLLKPIFVGDSGTFTWEPAGLPDVHATLAPYSITTTKNYFTAEGARLTYPGKLDKEVEGILDYKSVKRDTSINNPYPRFMSYYNNIKVIDLTEDVEYYGGFTLKGQKISSASFMGGLSRVILKNKGNLKAKSFSELYILEDSALYSDMASVTLVHGYDSIHHPAVRINFNAATDELTLQEAKNGFRNTPYVSTYFGLSFQADILRWNLNADSLDISILQGRNIVPAKFESIYHFNEADYASLGDKLYNFNPLGIVAYYAKENETDQFYVSDLAKHYKMPEDILNGAMIMLMQKGLIGYNTSSQLIEVKNKTRHLYKSKFGLTDYDNIIISSVIEDEPNATMNFDDGTIRIRGIEEFLISDSLFVKIEPDSAEIVMYENRDFSFNGKVTAGNFEYIGHDFTFSYDSFLIRLKTIDSVRFYIQEENAKGVSNRKKIDNALVGLDSTTANSAGLMGFANQTSGTLYINTPGNKSGRHDVPNYPKFAAGEGAVVYFERNNILDGVYKRNIYFVIPPFDIDSLNDSDPASIGFDGIFVSKGLLPNIEERLHYVGNNAMGFEHIIAPEGYQLYGGEGRIFGEMTLNVRGLRSDGRVEFLSTAFNSNDILLHPDSLIATGTMASIGEEAFNGTIFPQASLDSFKVKWLPREDEMLFVNQGAPFTFYNGIASFEGEIKVKSDGVYGKGSVSMKGSNAVSDQMKFEHDRFLARNADFEVETTNPEKPALAGDNVRLLFDLEENYAEIRPEVEGTAAIEFPYAQFKTSITKARWDLQQGTITMTKPDGVPLSSSYFYTTREDLDSLSFNATKAVYDINTQEMTVSGIPHIKVADALITPENNEVLILENSRIGQLTNTTIYLDTINKYHRLTEGVINIHSRNEFSGHATYQFVNASEDTFAIKMEDFRLERIVDENDRRNSEGSLHTVANGSVTAEDGVIVSPGMYYKGDMILYAHQPAMELDGYVKLDFSTIPGYDTWIQYSSNADQEEVQINFDEAITENGRRVEAGLLFNMYDNSLYGIFVNDKLGLDDEYLFKPSGLLRYKPSTKSYVIEDTAKAAGTKYEGKYFSFQESTGKIKFEGPVNFLKNTKDVEVMASVLGEGNLKEESFTMNSLLTFNFNIPSSAYELMAVDLIDVITNLGAPEGRGDQTQLLYKLSNIIGERATREFENASLQEYIPLGMFDGNISKPLTFADVNLKWSPEYKAFHSEGMLGMSNINKNEVNAAFEGFMEIKKNDAGGPVINIFIKASAASWYYFGLEENRLLLYSSNEEFNKYITQKSNAAKVKIDELAFIPGTEAEVLDFINRYRFEYYGINDPYVLDSAAEIVKEQEVPADEEVIEDDGF